jgi:hypothetical protein
MYILDPEESLVQKCSALSKFALEKSIGFTQNIHTA